MILVSVAGCGPAGPPPSANVNGNVTLDGKPLSAAQIIFVNTDPKVTERKEVNVPVSEGIFFAAMMPIGSYKVYLLPPGSIPGAPPVPEAKKNTPSLPTPGGQSLVKIPAKYQSTTNSGLTYDVKEGDNACKFELTSE